MSAATLTEMIALNATCEPILISDNKPLIIQESAIARTGIRRCESTREIQSAKGRPRSRANAYV